MFKLAEVLMIVEKRAGNSSLIDSNLAKLGIKKYFFETNDNIKSNKQYKKFLENLPPETLFCFSNKSSSFVILIPLIGSHINFPVKETETVWFYTPEGKSLKQDIHGYYLGRSHGMLATEDVGITRFNRDQNVFSNINKDISDKKSQSIKEGGKSFQSFLKGAHNKVNSVNDITKNELQFKSSLDSKSYENILSSLKNKNIDAVERYVCKSTDMVIQGTYGNIIKLTDESVERTKETDGKISSISSKIDIIAGLNKRAKTKTISNSKQFIVDQSDKNKKSETLEVNIRYYEDDILPVLQFDTHNETIKTPLIFPQETNKNRDIISKIKVDNYDGFSRDSSKIIVSENCSEAFSFLNKNFPRLDDIDISLPPLSGSLPSNIKSEDKKEKQFSSFYLGSAPFRKNLKASFSNSSSISAISENIVLTLHEDSNGIISILKPGTQDNIPSHLTFTNLGNIVLDAPAITIGDFKRFNNLSNGKTPHVFIGGSNINSQSLVLGEQLKEFIVEINEVSKKNLQETKNMLEKTHNIFKLIHKGISDANSAFDATFTAAASTIAGATTPPEIALQASVLFGYVQAFANILNTRLSEINSTISDYEKKDIPNSFNKQEELTNRLQKVTDNLDKILSTIAKTL
jgi:hypothetical protein